MSIPPKGTKGTITKGAFKGRHGTVVEPQGYWVLPDGLAAPVGPFYAETSFRADSPPRPPVAWGCNAVSSYEDAGMGTGLERAKALGLGWDRPYAQDPADIAWWMETVSRVGAAGLKTLVCIERRPYGADFPAVAAKLVAALRPWGVSHYEILNEPELAGVAPAEYADLLRDTVIECRRADPNAKFIAASAPDVQVAGRWVQWQTEAAKAVPDLGSYMDGWAIHPYGSVTSMSHSWGGGWNLLDYERGLWLQAGIDKPAWITEVGFKIGASNGTDTGTPAEQAARLAFYADAVKATPWIAGFFWFQWGNYGANEQWGLTEARNGTLRLAASSYKVEISA